MVRLSDIRPLFYAARFFGCGPHLVTSSDVLLTTSGLFYSSLWARGFVCCCIYGVYLIGREVDMSELKIVTLTLVRTLLAYVCFFVDGVLSMRLNERLRSALLLLRNFDVAVNYELKHPSDWRIRCRCWCVIAAVIVYWVVVGYVTYKCELTNPLFNAITYVIANAAISMQLIKFAGTLLLLRQRFRYLRKLLHSEAFVPFCRTMPETTAAAHRRRYQLQDVWWLHCSLSNAGDIINSVYSTQLLLWIVTMWLNALSRIYNINEGLVYHGQHLLKLREVLLATACIVNLMIICAACHFTTRDYNLEIGMYFNLQKLQFSAAGGFIQIDLPLLLSIAGAMTTYLVVLHNNS